MKVAIFRNWIETTEIGYTLRKIAQNVRVSNSIHTDVLIPSAGSTLAFGIYSDFSHGNVTEVLEKMKSMQKVFENAFAIFVKPNFDAFFQLQIGCDNESERVQLLLCSSDEEAAQTLLDVYAEHTNTQKKLKQQAYFEQIQHKSTSEDMPRSIFENVCFSLDIPQNDCNLLLDTFASLSVLAQISAQKILQHCPVEKSTAEKVEAFFQAPILLDEDS